MSAVPKPSPTRRLLRRGGSVLVALIACVAGLSAPARADDPVFLAGPSGLPVGGHLTVRGVTPCPAPPGAGSWFANVSLFQDGNEISYVDFVVADDGSWQGDFMVPFGAVPGAAQLKAVCFDTLHHVATTLSYQSVDTAVGGTKATFAAAPASSASQGPLAVHSITPCPEPTPGHGWMAFVELVRNIGPVPPPSYETVAGRAYPVDASGNWSGTFDLGTGVLAGPAHLVASCYYTEGPSPSPDDVYYQPLAITITPPAATFSAKSLAFGPVRLGATSTARTVTMRNSGGAPMIVSSVTVTGPNAGDFRITRDTCAGHGLASGVTCSTSVTFRPGADGNRSATLRYVDSAASSPQYVALTGRGCLVLFGRYCL